MKTFILCAVILLTCTQLTKASPEEESQVPEDSLMDNELEFRENIDESKDESYQARKSPDYNEYNNAASDVNYEEDDDDDEMDVDTMEKTLGIEIPICAQYAELTYPLHLSHLTDCGKFYKCSNGMGYLFDCPAGEHWSVKLDRCDYPEFANCNINGMHQYKLRKVSAKPASDNGEVTDDNGDDSDSPAGEFEVDPRCEGGDPYKPLHFAHPKDCTKFYKCYMGKAYVIKCPKGQHWGQRLNRCEHPTLARCTASVRPVQASIQPASLVVPYMDIPEKEKKTILDDPDYVINDRRCFEAPDDRFNPTHFAHPSDCQMFYKCFNKFAYKVSCPLGLHYNEQTKACDYPQIANCQSFVEIQSAQQHIESTSIPDCSHGRNVNYGIQGSIKRYFTCSNGETYLRECIDGEFFNVNVMKCDHLPLDRWDNNNQWPTFTPYMSSYYNPMWWGMNPNFNHWQYPMPAVPHVDEQKLKTEPEAPRPPVNDIPLAPNVSEFPSWLPQLNSNVKSETHDSVKKSESDFDFQRGQFSSRCPQVDDPNRPVHLAHETSCKMFYKCFQQKAFLMQCPNQQEWSDELRRCDYHQFANCNETELARRKMRN